MNRYKLHENRQPIKFSLATGDRVKYSPEALAQFTNATNRKICRKRRGIVTSVVKYTCYVTWDNEEGSDMLMALVDLVNE